MEPSRELRMLTAILRANRLPIEAEIAERRRRFASACAGFVVPAAVQRSWVEPGGVRCALLSPPAAEPGLLVYLHGGAYQVGSTETHRGLCARLALATGRRVLSVDYRLAPEHRFPAPVHDVLAVYRALLREGQAAEELVLCGDSAGGGLALSTMIALREAGDPLPCAAFCLSPWTDLAGEGESLRTRAGMDPMLEAAEVEAFARAYLDGADPRSPLASPLYATLEGLPPLLLQVGDAELLLDDSTRFAAAAERAGVDVALSIWPEAMHSFQLFDMLPEARRAMDEIAVFVRRRLPDAPATDAMLGRGAARS